MLKKMTSITLFALFSFYLMPTDAFEPETNEDLLFSRAVNLRDYYAPITPDMAKDIRFIVSTLGNEPLLKLKNYKLQLEQAGDRLEEIHPLNFWKTIFTDEKLISAMHNIYKRKPVWKSFIKGMGKSLDEAIERNNFNPEYVEDFARQIKIDAKIINRCVNKKDWEEFAKMLLTKVERPSELYRYGQ